MNNPEENILKWRFDVSTFRLIGRELITDRITALFELVKNCYDANAQNVHIEFHDVATHNAKSKIIIKDDGIGMDLNDIKDKWMVVGTAMKRLEKISPEPFRRRYVGEKGIGRFAVDKLGGKVDIQTKKEGDNRLLNVSINWDAYEQLEKSKELSLFTDIENTFNYTEIDPSEKGTTLVISNINEIWTLKDIQKLYRELSKIVSPYYPPNPPFDIFISSNENIDVFNKKKVIADVVDYASTSITINYNNEIQESLSFNSRTGKIVKEHLPTKSFGPIKMQLHYFNREAKAKYNSVYKDADTKIDGVKIYRDGLITTPFAEFEDNRENKRDILGIDKKLWHGVFDKISTREVIGIVEITKENNPFIIDSTNRQNFVENVQYGELKEFIYKQLTVLAALKMSERNTKKNIINNKLKEAESETKEILKKLEQLSSKNPSLKSEIDLVKKQASKIKNSVKVGYEEKKRDEKEQERREEIYLNLMNLQEYAAHVSHAVRTSLGKVKRQAEFFNDRYPDPSMEKYFKLYATDIYNEMDKLNKAIDFMLSYAVTEYDFEDVELSTLLNGVFSEYSYRLQSEEIFVQKDFLQSCVISCNLKFFDDIFNNLIDNSIKALSKNDLNKTIKCSTELNLDNVVIYFSDNGIGIPKDEEDSIFEIFYTTTATQGGSGLGLYIAKTRISALKGDIELCESEFKPSGATFKITLPFKKNNNE